MITIKSKKEISEIYLKKNRLDFRDFVLYYKKNSLDYPRFVFIASKKVFKKSVLRNRVKRLLRQAVRSALINHKNLNCDILIIGKLDILKKKSYELYQEIKIALEELEKLC